MNSSDKVKPIISNHFFFVSEKIHYEVLSVEQEGPYLHQMRKRLTQLLCKCMDGMNPRYFASARTVEVVKKTYKKDDLGAVFVPDIIRDKETGRIGFGFGVFHVGNYMFLGLTEQEMNDKDSSAFTKEEGDELETFRKSLKTKPRTSMLLPIRDTLNKFAYLEYKYACQSMNVPKTHKKRKQEHVYDDTKDNSKIEYDIEQMPEMIRHSKRNEKDEPKDYLPIIHIRREDPVYLFQIYFPHPYNWNYVVEDVLDC